MTTSRTERRPRPDAPDPVADALTTWDRHDVQHRRGDGDSRERNQEFLTAVMHRAQVAASTAADAAPRHSAVPAWLGVVSERLALADVTDVRGAIWFIACLPAFLTLRLGGWPAVASAAAGLALGTALEYVRTGSAGAVGE